MLSSRIIVVGAIVSVSLLFAGCQAATQTPTPSPVIQVQPVAGSKVSISQNAFSPGNLLVKVGQKVTWTNNDSYAHTITSDDGTFDSGNLGSGQSFSFTFTKAGTFKYHCTIHTYMTAEITVTQ